MTARPDVSGRQFLKLSGSGNDFIVFDCLAVEPGALSEPGTVERLCTRGTGVGADGVVFLLPDPELPYAIRYLNRDGSLGELCGNATLCAARLGVELGIVAAEAGERGFSFRTDAGVVRARILGGEPEIDLAVPRDLDSDMEPARQRGEQRMGYVQIGVPHLVVLCNDAEEMVLEERGAELRHHPRFPQGANVNFLSRTSDGAKWRYRTFERGVEGETLACGTGAGSCAVMLREWGVERGSEVRLVTSSGTTQRVTLPANPQDPVRLAGPATIVFRGVLDEIA